ncbi:mitochondrial amidoxime-reducing component 1 [Bombina bombina]|uniref:mitochondrial amidoxime-reducing component 1 n=1 Tax=Bombina bombina TaxID=8345 RepID=UPI00235AFF45|nr:mitochondrial amidoxime-reducing component 1 [Bombina bombina]XP_053556980.1 mitochondrial amidoxime-reducing component 1 [Bombina bombina]XP_053556982.1 mitochondrial amidoxime-reducing component 1 [Bombina bombina]XP_053556983.1 mitochondrial amidoxime-reducing component 1 [Bombina bombina]
MPDSMLGAASISRTLRSAVQSLPSNRLSLFCAAGLGITAAASLIWWWQRRYKVELRQVATVSQLLIYPIKSCKAVSVQEAECTILGLINGKLGDRQWLVVTEEGQMVTGRQEPRIVLISVNPRGESLCLEAPEMEKLLIPITPPKSNKVRNCRVFGSDIQGRDCGEEVSHWLTSYFQSSEPYHLVHFEPDVMQPRKCADMEKPFKDTDIIAYPDASPVMLLSEASLVDLNSRLSKPVTLGNFRPCIVVSECKAFEEDGWDDVRVGTIRLRRVMACGRCILTTVDPDTGVMSRKEPLDTLRTFRKSEANLSHLYKTAPLFGQYYGVEQTGKLRVGDPVYHVIKH